MTCIVDFETKKELREALAQDCGPALTIISDPSIFNPRIFPASDMTPGQKEVVTNHPKRSWFATIERLADGRFRVT